MAHAIGCLGISAAVRVCRQERAKRKNVAPLVRVPIRNQQRTIGTALIIRAGDPFVRKVKCRQGYVRGVARAFCYAEKVVFIPSK